MKAREFIFLMLVGAVLFGPAVLFGFTKADVAIPENLSAACARYLAGGVVEANTKEAFNLPAVIDGEFQSTLEKEIENYIPAKAAAMLGYSALQRAAIEMSNLLFNWECYLVSYDSQSIYIPAYDAITGYPKELSADYKKDIDDFFNMLVEYSARHPDINYVVYLVADNSQFPACNPAYELTSDSATFDDVSKLIGTRLRDSPSVKFLCSSQASLDEYYDDFYGSDLHWNCEGALSASNEILSTLDLPSIPADFINLAGGVPFSGTEARRSLMLIEDEPRDNFIDYSSLYIEDEDGMHHSVDTHEEYWNANKTLKHFYFYELYCCSLENKTIQGGSGKSNVLLVSDSFGSSIQSNLALFSHGLVHRCILRETRKTTLNMTEEIENNDIDTVVFVARFPSFATFNDRNPNWFDG